MKTLIYSTCTTLLGVTSASVFHINGAIFYVILGVLIGLNIFFVLNFIMNKMDKSDSLESQVASSRESKKKVEKFSSNNSISVQ